jgi:hypothetical protein
MTDDTPPDFERGIYRVTHTILVGTSRFICRSDLVFLNEQPFAVLEWGGVPENQHPALTLPLDASRLEPMRGDQGHFLYNGDLVDPRKPH